MENNKKFLIIGAVALVSGVAFYFVFKKKGDKETPLSNNTLNTKPNNATNSGSNTTTNTGANATTNTNTPLSSDMSKRIVVNSAFYGERNNLLDIKETVNRLIRLGMNQFTATNAFFGSDPSRGNPKFVMIDYSIDGKKVPLAIFNGQTPNFRADIDGVKEGNVVTLFKKS